MSPADFLSCVADDDASIDLRGLLVSGRCRVDGSFEEGFVACSTEYPYAVAWGRPAIEVVRRATAKASLALAARLGFTPLARLTSFVRR